MINRAPDRQAPYVGASAFTTKAGIHASAIARDPRTYEHIPPETVGNRRHVLVSDQAGKANLLSELARLGVAVERDDRRLEALLREVKERESIGYAYEAASASFELLARRILGTVPNYFAVESFHVTVERRHNAVGEMVSVSEAVVKVLVGGERLLNVGEGNGPVNALDHALRKDLGSYREAIADLEAHRLQGAHPQRRHRSRHPRPHRERRRLRGFLVHGRGIGEHRRCLVRGAERCDRLQAARGQGRRRRSARPSAHA